MTSQLPTSSEHASSASRRGVAASLAICVFGLLVFWGIRKAPQPWSADAPLYAPPEVPAQKLRFVRVDARRGALMATPVTARLQKLHPDYLLLCNFRGDEAAPLADLLKMPAGNMARQFQPVGGADTGVAACGVCLLSRHPLYEAQPLSSPASSFGIIAYSVVDNRKFLVACVQMHREQEKGDEATALVEFWRSKRSDKETRPPPIVVAGDLAGSFASGGLVQQGTGWFDGLTAFTRIMPPAREESRIGNARVLFSPGWSCTAGGIEGAAAGTEPLIAWVDAASARVVGTTSATWEAPEMDEP